MIDFTPFPKVPRLSRECVITEKIDGTNASVWITHKDDPDARQYTDDNVVHETAKYLFHAGSRKRFITPGDDNFGFAAWVRDHAEELVKLGPGAHFGEWWGKGIQRGYGLDEKRFSLFNVGRWLNPHLNDAHVAAALNKELAPSCCHVVPVLAQDVLFDAYYYERALGELAEEGSRAAPGFNNPEGIMIYHTAARQYFKKTFMGDEKGKGE